MTAHSYLGVFAFFASVGAGGFTVPSSDSGTGDDVENDDFNRDRPRRQRQQRYYRTPFRGVPSVFSYDLLIEFRLFRKGEM